MDNFIDKLAQKFIAGEVIKANSVAEEKELKRLHEQVSEYERCLQEMRKLQMMDTQTAKQLQELMTEAAQQIEQLTKSSLMKIEEAQTVSQEQDTKSEAVVQAAREAVEDMRTQLDKVCETMNAVADGMTKNQEEISRWFQQADDFLHKENVKVYRNVQAVVVEEVGKKAEEVIKAQQESASKGNKPLFVMALLAFIAAMAGVVLQVMDMLKIPLI